MYPSMWSTLRTRPAAPPRRSRRGRPTSWARRWTCTTRARRRSSSRRRPRRGWTACGPTCARRTRTPCPPPSTRYVRLWQPHFAPYAHVPVPADLNALMAPGKAQTPPLHPMVHGFSSIGEPARAFLQCIACKWKLEEPSLPPGADFDVNFCNCRTLVKQ